MRPWPDRGLERGGTDLHIPLVGRLGADRRCRRWCSATRWRSRRRRWAAASTPSTSATWSASRAHRLRPLPVVPRRPASAVPPTPSASASTATAGSPDTSPNPSPTQRLAPPRGHGPRRRGDLRPVRQRRALGAELQGARRGRPRHGRRTHRHHVGGRRAHAGRARRVTDLSPSGWTSRVDGRGHASGRRALDRSRRRHGRSRHGEGFDVGLEMSGARRLCGR